MKNRPKIVWSIEDDGRRRPRNLNPPYDPSFDGYTASVDSYEIWHPYCSYIGSSGKKYYGCGGGTVNQLIWHRTTESKRTSLGRIVFQLELKTAYED